MTNHLPLSILSEKNTIMTMLKQQTQTAHKALEKNICFKQLFSPSYSLSEYTELLIKLCGYIVPLENVILTDLPPESQSILQHRCKVELFSKDLIALGIEPTKIPYCHHLPKLDNFAQKMGAFYVIEGSSLGGRVIEKHLITHFGENIKPSLNYYHGYGEELNKEWSNFSQFMIGYFETASEETINTLISSANETFIQLQNWLEN